MVVRRVVAASWALVGALLGAGAGCGGRSRVMDGAVPAADIPADATRGGADGRAGAGTSGRAGTGGRGGEQPTLCVPGAVADCYSGPEGSVGVGVCASGTKTCDDAGSDFGPCEGEVAPTIEDCTTSMDEDCDGHSVCEGRLSWSRSFGGNFALSGLAVAADGRIALAGSLRGSVDFGGRALVSGIHHDVVVACFDAEGEHLWSRLFGDDDYQYAADIAFDPLGNVVIAGSFLGTLNFGGDELTSSGRYDLFLAKLDPEGNHSFSVRFGSDDPRFGDDMADSVAVDTQGNIVVGARVGGPIDFGLGTIGTGRFTVAARLGGDGTPLGAWPVSAASTITSDPSGSIFGAAELFGDMVVVKLDTMGNELYRASVDAGNTEQPLDLAVDRSGSALVAGGTSRSATFDGTPGVASDILLAKIDPDGDLLWQKQFGDADVQTATSVAIDELGAMIVVGSMAGTVDFGLTPLSSSGTGDVFVVKLDPQGAPIWAKHFARQGVAQTQKVAIDASGCAIVAGNGQTVLDQAAVELEGLSPVFIARFGP